jgi:hypothetical protein
MKTINHTNLLVLTWLLIVMPTSAQTRPQNGKTLFPVEQAGK